MSQTTHNATTAGSFQLNADGDGPAVADEGSDVMGVRTAGGALGRLAGGDPAADAEFLTLGYHPLAPQLIHFIHDGGPGGGFPNPPYTETVTGGLYPTLEEWTDNIGTKIASKAMERSAGGATPVKPTPITWRVYNADGVTGLQAVDVITYTGIYPTSRVRTTSSF